MIPYAARASAALALLLLLGRPAAAQEGIAYGPDPQQLLDICKPSGARSPSPAVLMIHGGSWRFGSRSRQGQKCEALAEAGIVAIPTDYRLATGTPATTWPAQLEDVQLAMRWVRQHAASYGIDPGHVCVEGDSAGGQLALLLGVLSVPEPGEMQALLPGVSPQAQCVVAISGAGDLTGAAALRPGTVGNLLGNDPQRLAAQERSASAALRVQRGAAPTLLVHGVSDRTVPFGQAQEMQAALARVGTPAWLVSYNGTHVLKGLSDDQRRAVWGLIASFIRTPHLSGPPRQLTLEEALAPPG